MKRVTVVAGAIALAACGTTPSIVKNPTVVAAKVDADTKAAQDRYRLGDSPDAESLSEKKNQKLLPVEKTYAGMIAQVRAHHEVWSSEAESLHSTADGLTNTQVAGGLLGAAGAIAEKIDVTKVGAGVVGLAGVWGNTYKFRVQGENYRLAASAALCIYTEIEALPTSYWTDTYKGDGSMVLPRELYVEGSTLDEVGYNKLSRLFNAVNNSVNEVRNRLWIAQRAVSIASPSADDILGSLKAADKSSGEAALTAQRMGTKLTASASSATVKLLGVERPLSTIEQRAAAVSPQVLEQALKLPESLTLCTKRIGAAS